MNAPPAIDLRDVGVQRGGRWILRDLCWSVPAGTCAAILGPNGSGKSTLARLLARHLWPTAGEIRVLPQFTNALDARRHIRLVQAAGPLEVEQTLTAREAVLTGFFSTLALYDPVMTRMKRRADELLKQMGLSAVSNHPYSTLSSGERMRVLIARALAVRPRLLILDEPTAGLDLRAREQVLAAVASIVRGRDDRPTVIFITHHVEELPPITADVLLLHEGKSAAAGPPSRVLTAARLSRVYGCRVAVRRRAGRFYLEVHPRAWKALLEV